MRNAFVYCESESDNINFLEGKLLAFLSLRCSLRNWDVFADQQSGSFWFRALIVIICCRGPSRAAHTRIGP